MLHFARCQKSVANTNNVRDLWITIFWVMIPCTLVDRHNFSEEHVASILRASVLALVVFLIGDVESDFHLFLNVFH
jgi:hypothetical protein